MTDAYGSVDTTPILLLCQKTGNLVNAELIETISEKNLADWEAEWVPELQQLLKSLNASGVDRQLWPQSRHWNWRDKAIAINKQLSNQSYSIVCNGITQAMMILDLTRRAQIPTQKNNHLVYIDFLEAAPWNRLELTRKPSGYSGCGSVLIRTAIELSLSEGFKGRIGLHSLPQSNEFYGNRIGMSDLGKDPSYQNLRYFEMTQQQAKLFLDGELK